MSEKRFIRNIVGNIYDSEKDKWFEEDWKGKPLDYDDDLIVFLNEQQALINALKKENKGLKEDLKKGFDVPIPYVENSMRRLRAEHKVDEQQATIENYQKSRDKWRTKCHQAEEKVEYWKHKSLDLYKLLRRVNLSDKEWEEFLNIINEKELEDE